jgi:hypothetical protein
MTKTAKNADNEQIHTYFVVVYSKKRFVKKRTFLKMSNKCPINVQ